MFNLKREAGVGLVFRRLSAHVKINGVWCDQPGRLDPQRIVRCWQRPDDAQFLNSRIHASSHGLPVQGIGDVVSAHLAARIDSAVIDSFADIPSSTR